MFGTIKKHIGIHHPLTIERKKFDLDIIVHNVIKYFMHAKINDILLFDNEIKDYTDNVKMLWGDGFVYISIRDNNSNGEQIAYKHEIEITPELKTIMEEFLKTIDERIQQRSIDIVNIPQIIDND